MDESGIDPFHEEINRLRQDIAHAMGMHVVAEPSGSAVLPTRYRLHDADGIAVRPSGGFFGGGWCQTEAGAWLAAPDVACDHNDAFAALEWLFHTHGIRLVVVIEHGGYRVELLITNPEIRLPHDGSVGGPTAPLAIARAIDLALKKKAETA